MAIDNRKNKRAKTYFTGKPCLQGHIAERYMNGNCTECTRLRNASISATENKKRNYDWRKRNPDKVRELAWKHRGLKEKPAREATKRCECCGVTPTKINLDHDHETGQFRGWLCNNCNVGIGMLGDTIQGVQQAVTYLRKVNRNDN